jgi:glyoxylase-like metal-dependent hydrolase (beta-lactamase superfamily II)/rhodanese-related sulfurtransferase
MTIEQIYTGCLAQGAYYIRSGNEAAIIDPLREVDSYIERAQNDGATIKYILETHFHADFVSGHLDLAAKTGASIVFGPTAAPKFKAHIATDGEELKVGNVTFKVLHTPGHTMESTTYLLKDEDGKEVAIFTGDTLFLGDVGRPDLAQKAAHLTKEQLAGLLFDSLHSKIIPLSDSLMVYPAHGAGSACGKNMSKDTVDTLGHQKQTNYALRASMSREEFINEVTDGLEAPPAYFPENVRMNKEGYESIDKVIKSGTQPLTTEEFELIANETGALILDTRSANDFRMGFIPNSINIGIEGSFAPWVGALIPGVNQPLLIVSDKGREEEVVTRLARVGYDNTLGYLNKGFESWVAAGKETDTINSIAAVDLSNQLTKDSIIIDVRKHSEFQAERVEGAINLPLDFINDHLAEIPKQGKVFIHCAGGYRSMIAISILKARGWDNLIDVSGGFKASAETAIPRTNFVCAK